MLIRSDIHVNKNILFWIQQVSADMQKKGPMSHNVHVRIKSGYYPHFVTIMQTST